MPNGRPGDHPYTDIATHGATVHSEAITELVLRIDDYGEFGAVGRAYSLLWQASRTPTAAEKDALEADLRALVNEIEQADTYPGESPLTTILDGDESLYNESIRTLVREIHDEIHEEIDNTRRGRKKLAELLWKTGWQPDDPDTVESELQEFRNDHWVWEK
jgi:hypothetical protein